MPLSPKGPRHSLEERGQPLDSRVPCCWECATPSGSRSQPRERKGQGRVGAERREERAQALKATDIEGMAVGPERGEPKRHREGAVGERRCGSKSEWGRLPEFGEVQDLLDGDPIRPSGDPCGGSLGRGVGWGGRRTRFSF